MWEDGLVCFEEFACSLEVKHVSRRIFLEGLKEGGGRFGEGNAFASACWHYFCRVDQAGEGEAERGEGTRKKRRMNVIFCPPVDIVGRGRDKCSRPAINGNFKEIHKNNLESQASSSASTTTTVYILF